MSISLFWILTKVPFAFRTYNLAAKVVGNLSIETPQDIKLSYITEKNKIHEKLSKEYPEELIKDKNSKFIQKLRNDYKYYAEKFEFEAKQKWGRQPQKDAYESAWAYSLAAEFYDKSGNQVEASDNYHYAGNAFRNLDAIHQAINHYQKSSELSGSRDEWKSRNDSRVKALKKMIGE